MTTAFTPPAPEHRHMCWGTHGAQHCDCALGSDHNEGAPVPATQAPGELSTDARAAHAAHAAAIGGAILLAIELAELLGGVGVLVDRLGIALQEVADTGAQTVTPAPPPTDEQRRAER